MTGLRGPLHAGAALALIGGLPGLIWFAVVEPTRAWQAAALQSREAVLRDISRLNESIAALTAERAALADGGALDIVWTAAQMGEATARIQSDLSAMASSRGIALRSVTPSGVRDLTLASAAAFRLEFEALLDQLTGFLIEVEYHSPALVVERATMRRLARPRLAGGDGADQPMVFVQIDLLAPVLLNREGG